MWGLVENFFRLHLTELTLVCRDNVYVESFSVYRMRALKTFIYIGTKTNYVPLRCEFLISYTTTTSAARRRSTAIRRYSVVTSIDDRSSIRFYRKKVKTDQVSRLLVLTRRVE